MAKMEIREQKTMLFVYKWLMKIKQLLYYVNNFMILRMLKKEKNMLGLFICKKKMLIEAGRRLGVQNRKTF